MNHNLTNLGEVQQQVQNMSINHHDRTISCDDIQFASLETMIIDGKTHPINPRAQSMITNRLRIPTNYLRRCSSGLQARNLNHHINKQKEDSEFLIRFDGNEIRAIFTPRYTPMDNLEVLQQLELVSGINQETKVQSQVDSDFLSISIPNDEQTFNITRGDLVTPGISICNSEVGVSSLRISAFMLRLVCTNGMVSQVGHTNAFRHISRRALDEFPQVLNQVGEQAHILQKRFKISIESKVDHPLESLNAFNSKFQLGKVEIQAVDWGFEKEPGETMFHIVNAYTKGAQFEALNPESSYRLQHVGGQILNMVN
ncbi:MAG: DUF932 domain-containing protein [Magnetococcales bacterium]|nr:DUF932 domain-containing protein [Magnetococcales bacterium]